MLSIKNVSIETKQIDKNKKLQELIDLIKSKKTHDDPISLLPNYKWHDVDFELHDVTSGFANAVRRVLVGGFKVSCLNVDASDIKTNDEFIYGLLDVLIDTIGYLPIVQGSEIEKNADNYNIHLSVTNDTTEIQTIYTKDIKISYKKKSKDSKDSKDTSDLDISELILSTNIPFIRLRPGKQITINNMSFLNNLASVNAGKFTLLDNVRYTPIGMELYDQFNDDDDKNQRRTIATEFKKFKLGFTTKGTMQPKTIMHGTVDILNSLLDDIESKVTTYIETIGKQIPPHYEADNCEITVQENFYKYKFHGHNMTTANMLAMQCYNLDPNVLYCSGTTERPDVDTAIINIKHADPNKLLLDAVKTCKANLKKIKDEFK